MCSSFALPGIGEAADALWAPVSAFLVQTMFGRPALSGLAFVEEVLPFTDVIPTALISWTVDNSQHFASWALYSRVGNSRHKKLLMNSSARGVEGQNVVITEDSVDKKNQ